MDLGCKQAAWPTFNAHTTFTTMMDPKAGTYNTSVWYGNSPP